MKTVKYTIIFVICFSFLLNTKAADDNSSKWVDSVYNTLSVEERIGQLFMVAAYSDAKKQNPEELKKLIKKFGIGGLIFFQGGPVRQANLTNHYQSLSKVPLLISIDGEWGLSMRLDSTVQFPKQMTLGAIEDDSLIYLMGKEIAKQCKRLGIHSNLAPSIDINNNPANPVIGNRSFGEDKYSVTKKALMYMKGMQDEGVLACAKHFPGHGDTESDSHKTLPIINASRERIDSLELYPFKELIKAGVKSIMVAHLFIPSIDSTTNQASTLSKKVVTNLLKEDLKYEGLIYTDALNMKGVSKFHQPGIVDVKALIAGNDVLLFSENVAKAVIEIKKAMQRGEISQDEIDIRCKKILKAKYWCNLNKYKPIDLKNLYDDLNSTQSAILNRKLTAASITVVKNEENIVPIKNLETYKIASVCIGSKKANTFQQTLNNYSLVENFSVDKEITEKEADSLVLKLKNYNLIILSMHGLSNSPSKDYGLSVQSLKFLKKISSQNAKTILAIFGSPYVLNKLDSVDNNTIIVSYEDNYNSQSITAQVIFGAIKAKGKLPVSTKNYKSKTGVIISDIRRLKYSLPEELGINPTKLSLIDTIALKGIKEKAYPGCQIFVSYKGNVIYSKSIGYHTYENNRLVENTDLYDLASITKIASSTLSLMKLTEEKKIYLDDTLGKYLPQTIGTNKSKIILRELLTHQAGLKDWIPFYLRTIDKNGNYNGGIYDSVLSDTFSIRVAKKLYMNKMYKDTMYKKLLESPIAETHQYKYSDIGYYFTQQMIESISQKPLNEYVYSYFYNSLGLNRMVYRPKERFSLFDIVPTENDTKFRKQLIHGDVHDYGAAMLGGVAGHAGLFSNATSLGTLMQMLLQKGEYAGVRYLDSSVVNEFTKCQYCVNNRRALGFDKPETNKDKDTPVCDCVSYLSFGHTGFTGTITWVDPEKELVYVFLSNRIHPDAENNKLTKMGIRTSIQRAIYDCIN